MDSNLVIVIISAILMLLGVKFWQTGDVLINTGKTAKGIVFKNNYKGKGANQGLYFPVVRFLTDKNEWITQELSIGQNPPMEEGKKITVIYAPEDPKVVDIQSAFRQEVLPRILVAVGLSEIIIGLLMYLEIIEFA
ncbi:DUF3592 domain-containing protein [Marinoscillum sp.]|uniref:DUF3592 domain-containing protein n=1 Tax=Marinoscillum sp. TaxID=2024838 RepID=UPI0033005BD9